MHVTFLLILIFFIYEFAIRDIKIEAYGIIFGFGGLDASTAVKYLFSTITSVLFFSTLLFHELSHSIVAQGYGIKIKSITLFIIGGVAQMEDIPKEPRMEAWISAAGPAFSLTIGIIAYAIYDFFGPANPSMGALGNGALIMLGIIAFYNIILGIFNLIPAFPMDGGRILRALLATRIPYINATRKAVAIGKSMAFMMGIFGLLTLAGGGILFLLIAFFIYYGAAGEGEATAISVTLEGLKVKDLMTSLPDVVHALPDWTLDQLIDVMFKTKHMGYPVQESHAAPVLGVITFSDVRKTPEQRGVIRVRDVMVSEIITIEADADAFDAFKLIASEGVGRLIVMDRGRMVGIVSRTDLMRSVQFRGAYGGGESV